MKVGVEMMFVKLNRLSFIFIILTVTRCRVTLSAPKSWPYMKEFDIWDSTSNQTVDTQRHQQQQTPKIVHDNLISSDGMQNSSSLPSRTRGRKAKVINFFSLPIDDECLSDDGRRTGICMNVYECRIQGGISRGDCAYGFGSCCVFEATCGDEVHNNITYFVSPKFPALMKHEADKCILKIKTVSDDIGQIRLDFLHFTLSQPNRFTGHCESDIFSLVGGILPFNLCGQNSGQHVFYDILSPNARAAKEDLAININLNKHSYSSRLWEIKITQIPFSARAPTGCLQYHSGVEGIIQTFNFADNGRHLANQNYKSCIRQEERHCSIQYEPCNAQSFRIGPMRRTNGGGSGTGGPGFGGGQGGPGGFPGDGFPGGEGGAFGDGALADETGGVDGAQQDETQNDEQNDQMDQMFQPPDLDNNNRPPDTSMLEDLFGQDEVDPVQADETQAADDALADETQADETQADETQADEGSGGGDGGFFDFGFPSFPSIFRSLGGFAGFGGRSFPSSSMISSRDARQLYSTCTDRITMPCIIEDFIGMGYGDVQSCSPIHCGSSLCRPGVKSCRIETAVTPFHVGVHFGDGKKINKGGPEDNIGACIRYKQLPC